MVTSEGKLCILDYGLMTDVAEENRFLLLEFIANLLAKDYTETLDGLAEMGFIPKEIVQGETSSHHTLPTAPIYLPSNTFCQYTL